jgi:hypothetical protein
MTFSKMVEESIKKKERLFIFIKSKEAAVGNDLHFPDEILKITGNDPEFSTAKSWRICSTIKKLCLKKTISFSDWTELELIEIVAKNNSYRIFDKNRINISNNKSKDLLSGYMRKIHSTNQNKIKRLIS